MDSLINGFLSLSLLPRVAIALFLLFLFFCWILGRKILWIASALPYLLKKTFQYLYLLVEIPVSILHKRLGTVFYKIDKCMSYSGAKIDLAITNWYNAWHNLKKINFGMSVLVYVILVIYISVPPLIGLKWDLLLSGQKMYLSSENAFVGWAEQHGWYNKAVPVSTPEDSLTEVEPPHTEYEPINLALTVSGTSVGLSIRDIPSTQNCEVLDQIYNGDTVIWSGEFAFGDADYGKIEAWVKVKTKNEVEGWARLYFLHPEDYSDFELYTVAQEVLGYPFTED